MAGVELGCGRPNVPEAWKAVANVLIGVGLRYRRRPHGFGAGAAACRVLPFFRHSAASSGFPQCW